MVFWNFDPKDGLPLRELTAGPYQVGSLPCSFLRLLRLRPLEGVCDALGDTFPYRSSQLFQEAAVLDPATSVKYDDETLQLTI